ncbi:MAG TPA: sigma-70 family RNA polymerase sigma factor [Terriglobia bacterium]|nr:sigma-70 family RNA polymerase sigma factor [Terriglobia bacterium]
MQPREPTHDVTQLLQAWGKGDQAALDRLMPLVYQELRRIAKRHMLHERPGHTLQTTALANEVYLRLVDVQKVTWHDRAHFFAICANTMRRILVDFARSRGYQKRGGGEEPLSLDESLNIAGGLRSDLPAIDEALKRLAEHDPRKSQVVELRFFGGLSVEETAEALKISPETVMRDWKMARAWLYRELGRKK